jgi:hypothetical protein
MAYEYDRLEREEGGGSFLMGLLAGTVLERASACCSPRRLVRSCGLS